MPFLKGGVSQNHENSGNKTFTILLHTTTYLSLNLSEVTQISLKSVHQHTECATIVQIKNVNIHVHVPCCEFFKRPIDVLFSAR